MSHRPVYCQQTHQNPHNNNMEQQIPHSGRRLQHCLPAQESTRIFSATAARAPG